MPLFTFTCIDTGRLFLAGNPRTVDNDGPYNLTLLTQQVLEIDVWPFTS